MLPYAFVGEWLRVRPFHTRLQDTPRFSAPLRHSPYSFQKENRTAPHKQGEKNHHLPAEAVRKCLFQAAMIVGIVVGKNI